MIFQIHGIYDAPTVAYFNNGFIFPPGTYVIRYVRGAMLYGAGSYRVNAFGPTSSCFFVDAENNPYHDPAPGLNTDYATQALAEAGNVGQQVIVTLTTPSTIGIWLDDSIYADNGIDTEAPLFELEADVAPYDPDSPYKTLILSDGPFIYYRHGEDDGTPTAFDSSGHAHHGTYEGNVQLQQSGIIVNDLSKSVYFAGDSYVDIPVVPLQNLTQVTVECWFVWDSDQPNQRIFDFNNGVVGNTEGKYFFCSVYHHESGLCRAAVSLNGLQSDVIVDSVPIIANRKYHVVCTLGNAKLAIFINGVKIQEADTDITLADLGITQAWSSRSPWTVDTNFKGKKDEFVIYDKILGDTEILEHYILGSDETAPPSNIKELIVDDHIIFNQSVSYFKQPAAGGQVYSFTISDTLNFADGTSGPPQSHTVKDILFFTSLVDYDIFPTRMLFKDQLVFVDHAHGSPHRILVKDTLVFTENVRHNQHPVTIQDELVFVDIPDPHWFAENPIDVLDFDEIFWGQNNHQFYTDTLAFTESLVGRFSIKNFTMSDMLTFTETATLRWSIANITIVDTLNFVDEFHRILDEDYTDVLVFVDVPLRVFPETIEDELDFVETIDYASSQVFFDELTFVEIFCVESSLSRSVLDTLNFKQYATYLINGPDDPRNGGGSPGNPGGPRARATYRRTMLDRLIFRETVESDPAPSGKDCVVEVN